MEKNGNEKNIELLLHAPEKYILENQKVIEIIVSRYQRGGYFAAGDKNEVVQYINLRLLDGVLHKMREQYNQEYFLSTYFAAIVNNLCKEYLVKSKNEKLGISYEEYAGGQKTFDNSSYQTLLNDEIDRLEAIFRMYHKKRLKLYLSLKLFFRIPISPEELKDLRKQILRQTPTEPPDLNPKILALKTDAQLFELFAKYAEDPEDVKKAGEALKRWIYVKIHEIIDLLNGTDNRSNYDIETLGILFAEYAAKKSNP